MAQLSEKSGNKNLKCVFGIVWTVTVNQLWPEDSDSFSEVERIEGHSAGEVCDSENNRSTQRF